MEPPENSRENHANGQTSTVTVPIATIAENAVAEADPAAEKEQISSMSRTWMKRKSRRTLRMPHGADEC